MAATASRKRSTGAAEILGIVFLVIFSCRL
jgi:hypothetical protein